MIATNVVVTEEPMAPRGEVLIPVRNVHKGAASTTADTTADGVVGNDRSLVAA